MTEFVIREVEGMRQVSARLDNSAIRAVAGALSHLEGDVTMTAPLPGPRDILRMPFSKEARIRPRYRGTGTVYLEPSMGGFHVFEARQYRWILEPGVFWAAEGDMVLGLRREPFLTSLWAGDGLIKIQTTVQGDGAVVIRSPGPVEEIDIAEAEVAAQGRIVLGRTEGLRYRVRRPTGFFQTMWSGERRVRSYRGTGKVLVCWTPYWNRYMHKMMTGEDERLDGQA